MQVKYNHHSYPRISNLILPEKKLDLLKKPQKQFFKYVFPKFTNKTIDHLSKTVGLVWNMGSTDFDKFWGNIKINNSNKCAKIRRTVL